MRAKWTLTGVCFLWAVGAGGHAAAQDAAYKCGAHTYSSKPCSGKVISETPKKAGSAAKKRGAIVTRRLPGETDEAYEIRRRRAGLSAGDVDECKRLDAKLPFEEERLKHSVTADETKEAKESIESSRMRYAKLGC